MMIIISKTFDLIKLHEQNDATHVWKKDGTAYKKITPLPTVKYGGCSIMIWAFLHIMT